MAVNSVTTISWGKIFCNKFKNRVMYRKKNVLAARVDLLRVSRVGLKVSGVAVSNSRRVSVVAVKK